MAEKFLCPICGDTTSSYMGRYRKDKLCKKHASALKSGELLFCEKCEKFHYKTKPCACKSKKKDTYMELPSEGFDKCIMCKTKTSGYAFCRKCYYKYTEDEMLEILNKTHITKKNYESEENKKEPYNVGQIIEETVEVKQVEDEQNKVVVIDSNNKSKCITCGKQADGLLFCASCYQKYKSKELLFKITNCTSVELLDGDYEGRYTCKDGHIVKSKSERDIDNYLFEHGISHAYERELPYGATAKETLHPDFYLPNYLGEGKHVYIEHWGYNENNLHYTKTKKFKMPIYEKLRVTLICTYEKSDMGKIDAVLDRKLNKIFIKEGEINFEEGIISSAISKSKNNDDDIPF